MASSGFAATHGDWSKRLDHLAEYLRTNFLTERDELHRLRDTADEVLATLVRFKDKAQFPYELTQDKYAEPSKSHSTSAMILFSMGVAAGQINSSILVPRVSPRNPDEMPQEVAAVHASVGTNFKADLLQLRTNIENSRSTHPFRVSHSNSYGPDDPFTLLWLLELLRPFENDADLGPWYDTVASCAKEKVDNVFNRPDEIKLALATDEAVQHLFPILRIVQLNAHLKHVKGYAPPSHAVLDEYLRNRLHLHISYFSIPNSSYDAAELAFAMEALLLLNPNALDSATVDRCREVLLETQIKTPYWRPLRPFIATAQGKIILPLSVEIANSLLRSCEILEHRDGLAGHLSRNIPLFNKYTEWIFTKMVRGRAKGGVDGLEFVGWHSEHADDPKKVHPWETSQVQLYLLHYESILRRHRASTSLGLMGLKVKCEGRQGTTPVDLWSNVSDKKAPLRREPMLGLSEDSDFAIFHRIGRDYVRPRNDGGVSGEAHYSMLLYGPQGTGKTDLAENLARCLGQPLISISPSDFIVSGGALVEARAQAIFDVLGAQTDAVILMDEIDHLILDRDSRAYRKQGDLFQFMTPGMLTKFRDLRRAQRCIFVVSTNFAEMIDPAIKRVGRIDDQYLVMPPDKAQRRRIVRDGLLKHVAHPIDQKTLSSVIADVTDADLEPLIKSTPLFIPGEMQNIAKQALRTWKDSAGKEGLVKALEHEAERIEPTNRISSYVPRFSWNNNDPQGHQEPYLEFLMLFYLLLESGGQLKSEEKQAWLDCAKALDSRTGSNLKRELGLYLRDETVREALLSYAESVKTS